jgi:regulator of sigma E protease
MILFLISLIFCIAIHELSHLIVAKKVGCNVEVFSIGFGKPFYSFDYKGTRYNFSPILLGGYCRVKGENGLCSDADAFCNLTYTKKVLMIVAGCASNLITGIIAFFIGKYFYINSLCYFGYFSIVLGIGNLLPIPALDGFYPYGVLLEKIYGKEKGYELLSKINKIGFAILMAANIACIPLIIYAVLNGGF